MNWYQREEGRYVEYGSSLRAAQRFGIARQLTDTVYNLNQAHLARDLPTIFEAPRRRRRAHGRAPPISSTAAAICHEPRRDGLLTRLASPIMRHSVLGPRELFYADIFASGEAPCSAVLGMPGIRDRHSACVGAYLVEHDLFDMLLLSLPDNDWYSHKHGPDAQVRSLAHADAYLARVMEAGGGVEELPRRARGDRDGRSLAGADLRVRRSRPRARRARGGASARTATRTRGIAVCPSQRAAMVYVLDEGDRGPTRERILALVRHMGGVELACWMERTRTGGPRRR